MKLVNITRKIVASKKDVEVFNSKVFGASEGLQPYISNYVKKMWMTNATILADYIIAAKMLKRTSFLFKKGDIACLYILPCFKGQYSEF